MKILALGPFWPVINSSNKVVSKTLITEQQRLEPVGGRFDLHGFNK
jgi:hypothetical protein